MNVATVTVGRRLRVRAVRITFGCCGQVFFSLPCDAFPQYSQKSVVSGLAQIHSPLLVSADAASVSVMITTLQSPK